MSKAIWSKNSLISRILATLILVVSLVGVLTLTLSYFYVQEQTRTQALSNIEQLLNTVEPSLQVACFLNDQQLAGEVTRGLISNDALVYAGVFAYPQAQLSQQYAQGWTRQRIAEQPQANQISRLIYSPFDNQKSDLVGEVRVVLNEAAIARQNHQALLNMALPIVIQTLIALVTLVLMVVLFLAPKSRRLMRQVKEVRVDQGQLLACPPEDKRSEIGVLVTYINGLIERMYSALQNERELRQQQEVQQQKFRSIFENARSCIFLVDELGYVTSSNQACHLYQPTQSFAHAEQPVNLAEVLAPVNYELRYFIETMISERREAHFEAYIPASEGMAEHWLQVNLTPLDDDSIQGVINDITELKLEARTAQAVARTDELTRVANRLGFNDALSGSLAAVECGEQSLALLLIDLDRFKEVNDIHGHPAGDKVLVQVGERLRQCVREHDHIARLGGDEFVILLTNAEREVAERIAEDIIHSLNRPFAIAAGEEVEIGASIGIVVIDRGQYISVREVMHNADQELYRVKRQGRNSYGFFKGVVNE